MKRTANTLLLVSVVAWSGAALLAQADGQRDQASGITFSKYTVTDLGTFGGPNSEAWGINNAGQVVGRADLPPDPGGNVYYHAFLYQNGVKTDLGTLGPGCNPATSNSWAVDINDAGQIVGRTCSNNRDPRAFLWSGGVMVDLGTLGGTLSWARGINNSGDVVGTAALPGDPSAHAFLYSSGAMQDLGTLGGAAWSAAHDINDNGAIVGYSEYLPLPNREPHAFLHSNGVMTDLTPGLITCCSYSWGINDAGKVVGTASGGLFGAGHDVAFLYSSGTLANLGSLANNGTVALSINNNDVIVGYSVLGYNYYHAFLHEHGVMVDLNNHIPGYPEWDLNFATAINDVGQIAGIGTVGGHTHGFLLTPVQTPPTAVDDAYATGFQVPLNIPAPGVLANDYGSGLSSMVVGLVSTVAHGTLALNPDGGFLYTPAPGYAGVDTFTYKAINITGQSNLAVVSLTVQQPTSPQPPSGLFISSVVGNVVTLRWTPPLTGPAATGYTIEGGLHAGEILAIIPTGTAYPIFTAAAPAGSFYLRVHTLVGAAKSAPSNEILVHVNVPVRPSPPADLVSVVQGSTVNLAWRNTFAGGAPSNVFLEVQTGSGVVYVPLGLTDTFGVGGVPAGTYTLRLWAANATGVSNPSNQVVVTVPGACSGAPGPPSGFLAYNVGHTLIVIWDPPATGPAATVYDLSVSGSFVGSVSTLGRTLSGTAGPGSYHLSVVARNGCGSSPATPAQTVTIP